jgi:DNA-binding protein H-NS
MTTLENVQARIKKLQAQADALIAKQSTAVIGKIRDLMSEHGLTTADIDAHIGRKKHGPKAGAKAVDKAVDKAASITAKYLDPKSGATWSGRGRAPAWIARAKDRSRFLVDGNAASAAPAPASTVKTVGKYVRGPQPPKYRDPKSGATWSGRGPAPTWLASVKDRTRFLIDSAQVTPASGTVTKKPTVKAAPAKKTVSKTASAAKKAIAKPGTAAAKKVSGKRKAAPAVKKATAKKVASKAVSVANTVAPTDVAAAPIVA